MVQFDAVDLAGHTTGYGSRGHLDAISHADELLGRVIAKYDARALTEDTLILVTADHGGTVHCSHGDWSDGERFVFLGIAGKHVLHGEIGEVGHRDLPAVVLHALGVPQPPFDSNGYAAQTAMNRSEITLIPHEAASGCRWKTVWRMPPMSVRLQWNLVSSKPTITASSERAVSLGQGFCALTA